MSPPTSPPDDAALAAALGTVRELGPGRLDHSELVAVHELETRRAERLARAGGSTVVAVVGGTGVGKSALVNRVAGGAVVAEGVRRPTTDRAVAVGTPTTDSEALTTWLGIEPPRPAPGPLPDGLLLVDLPDHDSVVTDHGHTAARLAARVDGLVVVVDPLKYARADLRTALLDGLGAHAEVVVVALNRTDELPSSDVEQVVADLRHRLARDGLEDVEVIATSARTGSGVPALTAWLTELSASRRAADHRTRADLAVLGGRLGAGLGPPLPTDLDTTALSTTLLSVTDADRRVAAAPTAYRVAARQGTRAPAARVVRRGVWAIRGVADRRSTDATDPGEPTVTGDPTDPPVRDRVTVGTAAALAAATDLAAVQGRDHARLAALLERHAAAATPGLVAAAAAHDPEPTRRRWWTLVSLTHGGLELAALAGLLWLLATAVLSVLGLPLADAPRVGDDAPLPSVLLVGGLALRLLVGLLTRLAIRAGARRHERRLTRALRASLAAAVTTELATPLGAAAEADRALRTALRTLAAAAGHMPKAPTTPAPTTVPAQPR